MKTLKDFFLNFCIFLDIRLDPDPVSFTRPIKDTDPHQTDTDPYHSFYIVNKWMGG